MALLPMKKITLIAHASSRALVMKTLQNMGAVELIPTGEEELRAARTPDALPTLEGKLADVRASLAFIKKYDETKTGFLTPKPAISRGELKKVSERFAEADAAVGRIQKFSEEMNALKSRRQRLQSRIAQLEPFEEFDAPVESVGTGRYTTSLLGTIPNTATEKYAQIMATYAGQAYFETVDKVRSRVLHCDAAGH